MYVQYGLVYVFSFQQHILVITEGKNVITKNKTKKPKKWIMNKKIHIKKTMFINLQSLKV